MRRNNLELISTDELRTLYEKVVATLSAKVIAEKTALENRLRELNRRSKVERFRKKFVLRPYRKASPRFQNPLQPSETWPGRGNQPRWLTAQLRFGKHIDDFRINSKDRADRLRIPLVFS